MTRLQLQLRDAAEREARRGVAGHALRDARWRLRSPALAGALAAALLALAVAVGVLAVDRDPAPAGPAVVAELHLTGNPDQIITGLGSVWIADSVAGQIVRVDPERRAVTARIPVGSEQQIPIAIVGAELWAIHEESTLLRIDPATGRVADRVPLRTPGGRALPALGLLVNDRAVWAVSREGSLQLDPRTGAARRFAGGPSATAEPQWLALGEDVLWEYETNGTVRRFDAVTGDPRGRIRPQLPQTTLFEDFDGDLIASTADGRIGRIDGADGAVRWQRAVADRLHSGTYAGGLLWIHGTRAREGDRLVGLDPRDGAVVASLPMRGYGSTWMAAVGGELWINEPGGRTLVVRQSTR